MGKRYDELNRALDQAKNEHDIGVYLKQNLDLIRVFNEHSWNTVLSRAEFAIGTKYRADFLVLSACSGYWNCVLIEMQSPCDKIFDRKGEATKGLREAQRQVQDWKMYIDEYESAFREQLSIITDGIPAQCSNASVHQKASIELRDPKTVIHYKYKILIGRSVFMDENNNRRRNISGFEIVTFDRLLKYVKRLDEVNCFRND